MTKADGKELAAETETENEKFSSVDLVDINDWSQSLVILSKAH